MSDERTDLATAPLEASCEVVRIVIPSRSESILLDRPLLVGTAETCDVRIEDPTVSRRHVWLHPSDLGVRVLDADSRNGTWLLAAGGKAVRITDAHLPEGTTLRIGGTELTVARGSAPPRAASPADEPQSAFGRFLGAAPILAPLYRQLHRAASSGATVLLEGESGTGKEVLAEALHELGDRAERPFVVVDCGAIPETLVESELLGHERGAFTGADRARTGAFEAANGGTIFLDEIGELPLAMQTRLLRVLDREIRRVGGRDVLPIDVRVIAATNRNLDREVEEGRFRLDLFHRLAVVLLRVPPLRERRGDVELLARHFLERAGAPDGALSPDALARMRAHAWPGNVRELRNHVERLALFGAGATLGETMRPRVSSLADLVDPAVPLTRAREQWIDAFTDAYVEAALAAHGGNVSRAARAAGVGRRYFQRLKQRP